MTNNPDINRKALEKKVTSNCYWESNRLRSVYILYNASFLKHASCIGAANAFVLIVACTVQPAIYTDSAP